MFRKYFAIKRGLTDVSEHEKYNVVSHDRRLLVVAFQPAQRHRLATDVHSHAQEFARAPSSSTEVHAPSGR